MVNPRKAYPVDPGLIPIYERTGRSNIGHALESAVFIELERRGAEIGYVRTKNGLEVDFLAREPDGTESLIQVCTDVSDALTHEREVRSLEEAAAEFPGAMPHGRRCWRSFSGSLRPHSQRVITIPCLGLQLRLRMLTGGRPRRRKIPQTQARFGDDSQAPTPPLLLPLLQNFPANASFCLRSYLFSVSLTGFPLGLENSGIPR